MRTVQANIFWCFVEALRQINDTAVLVSSADEVVNQSVCFSQRKSSNTTNFWFPLGSSSSARTASLLHSMTSYPTILETSSSLSRKYSYFGSSRNFA